MYDERFGRTFDGIDGPSAGQVNRNAGAESTIEGLLALQRVAADPDASRYMRYRPEGDPAASLATVPDRREFAGPRGERLMLRRAPGLGVEIAESRDVAAPITLTYWPAANPAGDAARHTTGRSMERRAPGRAGAGAAASGGALVRRGAAGGDRGESDTRHLARMSRRHSWRGWSAPGASCGSTIAWRRRHVCAERTTAAMLASLRLPDGGSTHFRGRRIPRC